MVKGILAKQKQPEMAGEFMKLKQTNSSADWPIPAPPTKLHMIIKVTGHILLGNSDLFLGFGVKRKPGFRS